MIAPAFLIKILGFTAAAFLVVGVPAIVNEAHKASAETARKNLFQELFGKHALPDTLTAQEFETELSTWQPTSQQQKYLLDNWEANVHHLPKSFFTQYYSSSTSPSETPPSTLTDVCYLTIYLKNQSKPKSVHIPFLKDKLNLKGTPPAESTKTSQGHIKLQSAFMLDHPEPWRLIDEVSDLKFLRKLYYSTKPHLEALGFIERKNRRSSAFLGWNIPLCQQDKLHISSIIKADGEHVHAPFEWELDKSRNWKNLLA